MPILGLDHVAVAVKDMEAALTLYRENLGFELIGREIVEGMKVEVALLCVGGFHLELVRPLESDSAVGRFLERRGEGIHHIALKVTGISETLSELKEAGISLIDQSPRAGARGSKVAFLHPKSCHGTLVELCERADT